MQSREASRPLLEADGSPAGAPRAPEEFPASSPASSGRAAAAPTEILPKEMLGSSTETLGTSRAPLLCAPTEFPGAPEPRNPLSL